MRTFTPFEIDLLNEGSRIIAGIDEAGRGPIAGPVAAAAVIFHREIDIPGVNDSKSLKPSLREELADAIKSKALSWAVGISSQQEIDRLNILKATHLAMKRAVASLKPKPNICLVDGYPIPDWEQPHRGIIQGDRRCFTIAAASILAKVHRDGMMLELHKKYPQYGFDRHKGYPTKMHRRMIRMYGPSPVHRMTFKLLPEENIITKAQIYSPHKLGRDAENAAAAFIEGKGCAILARNYRAYHCEIDIIAQKGNTLIFIEVKSSDSDIPPETMVNKRKIEHIIRAANAFLTENEIEEMDIRFDLIAMRPDGCFWRINHIIDAFRP